MDKNKLSKLKEVDYKVKRCCGNCEYGLFLNMSWGTCKLSTYEHEKHTDSVRQLSINRYGYCYNHIYTNKFLEDTDHYKEFVE